MNALKPSDQESRLSRFLLLSRLVLALATKRYRYPLSCAALWSALKLMVRDIPSNDMETHLVITQAQVERFLDSGWDYTEPRLGMLQQVNDFQFNMDGARQLVNLSQQMEGVRSGSFEQVRSDVYEDLAFPVFQHVSQAFRNQVSGRLPFVLQTLVDMQTRPDRVCDAGCGAGIFLGDVLEQVPGVLGTGLDISQQLLGHARKVLGVRGLNQRVRLTRADIRNLPVKENTFDFVWALEVLEHLPDPASGLAELRRVLSPDGRLVTSIPVGDRAAVHLYVFGSADEINHLHASVGFKIERQQIVQTAPGIPNVISAVRKV